MRQSQLFTRTKRDFPKEEESKNAQLLIRGGFVCKEMAGVYSYLPLGLRIIRKIENIIRREMNETLGATEILMPALHPIEKYKKTKRENIDVLFHTESNTGGHFVLGQSHEEVVVPLVSNFVSSYRDLPLGVYQIQTKFRNEFRAKSGILRGKEFLMKDLYSFHTDEEDFDRYYKKAQIAYRNIFNEIGIGDKTYLTFASGGTFSKYSHEFQTVTDAGEDIIYLCSKCGVAINEEIIDEQKECPLCGLTKDKLEKIKSIEVANIFPLKTRFSDAFNLKYKNKKGEACPIIMGCYGIGVSRLMGAVVESLSDKNGMVWPESIAPFKVHIIPIDDNSVSEKIYTDLNKQMEVLYDDRDKGAGEKLKDADLIGIPYRIVVSPKTLENGCVEVKRRDKEQAELIKIEKIKSYVK